MNRLKTASALTAALAAALLVVGAAQAKPIAYPAKGQAAQQQQKDDGECNTWAKSNTGVDPAAVAAAPAAPPPGPDGARARGAAKGAIVGGVIDGNDGAKTGAAVGVVAGGSRSRQQKAAAAGQADAQKKGAMDTYDRAWSACMEGRGYTMK
jgi:hypothetical protein